MPGCVFHVSGKDFRPNAFLADSPLHPYRVDDSGFSADVSGADGDLKAEILDAIHFLTIHETELLRLRDFSGITDMRLDFGYYYRDVAAQFDYIPPDLIARAGRIGIGIELSLYPQPQPDEKCPTIRSS
jgi:hypothetical protein